MHWPAIYYSALLMLLVIFFMFPKVGPRQKDHKSLVCGIVGLGNKTTRGKDGSLTILFVVFSLPLHVHTHTLNN